MDKKELIKEIEERINFNKNECKAKGDYCDGQAYAYLMALSYIQILDEPKECIMKNDISKTKKVCSNCECVFERKYYDKNDRHKYSFFMGNYCQYCGAKIISVE